MSDFERKLDAKLILSVIATGIMSFAGVVVETAMNITFPTLMSEFNIGTGTVQWITTGYLLILSIIIPASSWLKRRFKTKTLFTAALTLFLLGTIIDAIAPTFAILLAGRLIQGIGTGIALPLMFNIVLEQAPYDKMGMMMGIGALITALAPAVGPSLGGMLVNAFGWRMIFIVLIPVLLIALLCGALSIQQASPTEKIPFQILDYILLAAGFICFIFATSVASSVGWFSIQVIGLFIASIILIALFCRRSLHSDSPLIRVQVFKHMPFTFSVCVILLFQFTCLGLSYLIPNYAQLVNNKNAFIAGCLLLPGCICGAIISPLSGKMLDKLGASKPILIGNVLIIIATIGFACFSGHLIIATSILFHAFFMSGQGFTVGNAMTNGLNQLPSELNTDGNAVINTLQQLAGATGTSVITTIVASSQSTYANDIVTGTLVGSQHAFYLLVVFAVAALICSIAIFRAISAQKK